MKAGQGKVKGGEYEREICRRLSLWISNGERKDLLCRTVGSGAQFTATLKGHAGDLMPQDPLAWELCKQYVIECKHWRSLNLIQFLTQQGDLYKALQKVQQEAEKTGKLWWLIARQNHQRIILLMPPKSKHFEVNHHLLFSGSVVLYYLDEFLAKIPPLEFLQ